jgi:hypothetical protein
VYFGTYTQVYDETWQRTHRGLNKWKSIFRSRKPDGEHFSTTTHRSNSLSRPPVSTIHENTATAGAISERWLVLTWLGRTA